MEKVEGKGTGRGRRPEGEGKRESEKGEGKGRGERDNEEGEGKGRRERETGKGEGKGTTEREKVEYPFSIEGLLCVQCTSTGTSTYSTCLKSLYYRHVHCGACCVVYVHTKKGILDSRHLQKICWMLFPFTRAICR